MGKPGDKGDQVSSYTKMSEISQCVIVIIRVEIIRKIDMVTLYTVLGLVE